MKKYCRVYSMILVLLLVLSGALTLQGAMAEPQLTVDLRGLNLVEGRNWRSVALHGVFDVADAQGNYLGSVTANSPEGSDVTVSEGTIVLTPRMESLPAGYAFESSYTAQVSETRSAVTLLAYKAEGLFEVRHGYEDGTPAAGGEFVLQDAFGQQAMAFATDAQGFYAANEPIPAGVYTLYATKAAQGALPGSAVEVEIPVYQGQAIAQVAVTARKAPVDQVSLGAPVLTCEDGGKSLYEAEQTFTVTLTDALKGENTWPLSNYSVSFAAPVILDDQNAVIMDRSEGRFAALNYQSGTEGYRVKVQPVDAQGNIAGEAAVLNSGETCENLNAAALKVTYVNAEGEAVVEPGFDAGTLTAHIFCAQRHPQLNAPQAAAVFTAAQAEYQVIYEDVGGKMVLEGHSAQASAAIPVKETFGIAAELTVDDQGQAVASIRNTGTRSLVDANITLELPQNWKLTGAPEGGAAVRLTSGDYLALGENLCLAPGEEMKIPMTLSAWEKQGEGKLYIRNQLGTEPVKGNPQGLLFAENENVTEPSQNEGGYAVFTYAAKGDGSRKASDTMAVLRGRLYEDKNGNGMPDGDEKGEAGLRVECENNGMLLRAFTQADGAFELPGTVEEGQTLTYLLPEHMMAGEANDRMEIPYTVTCMIRGSVTVQGAPMEGVTVTAAGQKTLTDEQGEYNFSQLTAGSYEVTFELSDGAAETYAFADGSRKVWTAQQVTLTETAKEARVDAHAVALGSITLDAQGMDGCPVKVEYADALVFEGVVENGLVTVPRLYPGEYRITAQLPQGMMLESLNGYPYVQKDSAQWNGGVSSGQNSLYQLKLAALGRIEGGIAMSGDEAVTVTVQGAYEAWSLVTRQAIVFENLIPGEYTLSVTLPQGCVPGAGCLWTVNGDTAVLNVKVEAGQTAQPQQLILARMGSIAGSVFDDQNANGLMDSGESGRGSLNVSLWRAGTDELLQSVKTDAAGAYRFGDLTPGEYYLTMEAPKGVGFNIIGESIIAGDGRSGIITVGDGQELTNMNATLVAPAGLKAVVFWDSNEDGTRGIYERTVQGITVSAVDQSGNVAATAVTDYEGQARFKNLPSGVYRVRFELPEGYAFSAKGEGMNESTSAIAKQESRTGETEPVTVAKGKEAAVGAGVLKLGFVSGKVWYDLDASGIMTEDEPGMAGITVKLESRRASGVDYELVTGENGEYRFAGVRPGSYDITVTAPEGMMFTRYSKTGRNKRSIFTGEGVRTGEKVLVVESGKTIGEQNIGLVTGGIIDGVVFLDADYDGFYQPGDETLAGVKLELEKISTGDRVASVTVGADGAFRFEALRGGNYRLKAVLPDETLVFTCTVGADESGNWFEAKNNRLDSTLQRLQLEDMEHKTVYVGAVRTGSISGRIYMDDNYSGACDGREAAAAGLDVSLVDAAGRVIARDATDRNGQYQFEGLVPGAYQVRMEAKNGYVFTRRGEGNLVTSLSDAGDGATDELTLPMGEALKNVDGGLILPGRVKGMFFNDANDNGIQDAGETGLPGVTVTLIEQTEGTAAFRLVTAADGAYSFNRVMPGTYYVRYDLPEGGAFAPVVSGGNSLAGEGMTAASDIFNFKTADEKTLPLAGGLVMACLEGRVYEDLNGSGSHDEGEPFLNGVEIVFDGQKQTTGEDGAFLVDGVRPGTYEMVIKGPEGYVFTRNGSAVAPRGQNAYQNSYEAVSGLRLKDLMIGMVPEGKVTGYIWMDEDLSGGWNEMDTMLAGMEVNLADTLDGATVYQVTTDYDGRFEFVGLVPGSYQATIVLPDACIAADAGYATFLDNGQGMLVQPELTVAAGETIEGLSAGIVQYTVLEGLAWQDEAGEAIPLPGTRVELVNDAGEVIGSMVTGEDGRYIFPEVLPGDYVITAQLPEGYLMVNDQDDRVTSGLMMSIIQVDMNTSGESYPLHIVMGAHESDLDIGAVKPGMLGDKAWLDENGNGLQETSEAPMPGVTVRLIKDGTVYHEAVTDLYGYYLFDNVYPSVYDVEVIWHDELVTTQKRTDFVLLGSQLEESEETSQTLRGVEVRSNVKNFNFDLGFKLREKGVKPEAMQPAPKQVWQ